MGLSLPVHLSIHFSFSLLAAFLVWLIWKKPLPALLGGILGGFLVDFDHFIDYYLAFGFYWKLDYFRHGYEFLKSSKIFLFFHAWEFVPLLALTGYIWRGKAGKSFLCALALGLFFHLATDVVVDDMPVRSYSLKYRAEQNFELKDLVKSDHYRRHLEKKQWVEFPE